MYLKEILQLILPISGLHCWLTHSLQWITSQQLYVQLTSWIFFACHANSQTRWAKSIYGTKRLTLSVNLIIWIIFHATSSHIPQLKSSLTVYAVLVEKKTSSLKLNPVQSWQTNLYIIPTFFYESPSILPTYLFSLWKLVTRFFYLSIFFVSMNKSFINKATYFVKL